MTTREKVIWAAGFIDGEGHVSVTRGKSPTDKTRYFYRPEISAGQVSRVPLDILAELFGGSVSKAKDKYGYHYQWRLYCKQALSAIEILRPYLIAKRTQADLVMEYGELIGVRGKSFRYIPDEVMVERESIFQALKQINKRRVRIHAERLNEETPTVKTEDDAIVRSHVNVKHESDAEMTSPLVH